MTLEIFFYQNQNGFEKLESMGVNESAEKRCILYLLVSLDEIC